MTTLPHTSSEITAWERLPEGVQRRLTDEERAASPKTPLLDGRGFWNDTSVPREMDRQRAETRVRARINAGGES